MKYISHCFRICQPLWLFLNHSWILVSRFILVFFSALLACFTVLGCQSVGITGAQQWNQEGSWTHKTPVVSDVRPHLFSFGFPSILLPALPATLAEHWDLNSPAALWALAPQLCLCARIFSPFCCCFWSVGKGKTGQGHSWALVVECCVWCGGLRVRRGDAVERKVLSACVRRRGQNPSAWLPKREEPEWCEGLNNGVEEAECCNGSPGSALWLLWLSGNNMITKGHVVIEFSWANTHIVW